MAILDLNKLSTYATLAIPVFVQAQVKVYPRGSLKEIHLSYNTMTASPEGPTAHKEPLPLSVTILVLIYCLYFTQECPSEQVLVLAIITMICIAHCNTLGQETMELTSYST